MSDAEFSVFQWFPDGSYECVRSYVTAEEAMKAYAHYTNNVASKMGVTQKVMITDGGDCCVAEWRQGEGYVWPPKDQKEQA